MRRQHRSPLCLPYISTGLQLDRLLALSTSGPAREHCTATRIDIPVRRQDGENNTACDKGKELNTLPTSSPFVTVSVRSGRDITHGGFRPHSE